MGAIAHQGLVFLRLASPALMAMALALIGAVRLPFSGLGDMMSNIVLLAVYYWIAHRPKLLPLPFVFFLGLISDILGESRVGLGPLMYVLMYGLTMWGRRFLIDKSFLAAWLGAALSTGIVLWTQAAIIWLRDGIILPPAVVFISWMMITALYPVAGTIFSRVQRHVLQSV